MPTHRNCFVIKWNTIFILLVSEADKEFSLINHKSNKSDLHICMQWNANSEIWQVLGMCNQYFWHLCLYKSWIITSFLHVISRVLLMTHVDLSFPPMNMYWQTLCKHPGFRDEETYNFVQYLEINENWAETQLIKTSRF